MKSAREFAEEIAMVADVDIRKFPGDLDRIEEVVAAAMEAARLEERERIIKAARGLREEWINDGLVPSDWPRNGKHPTE